MKKKIDLKDLNLVFAHEAMARARDQAGEAGEVEKYVTIPREAGKQNQNQEEQYYFFTELQTIHQI